MDVGKTVSKLSLWSQRGRLLDRQLRINELPSRDGAQRLDVHGIADWLVAALAAYRGEPVEAIVPVGHGAGVVAIAQDGLAFEPLDYEQSIPDNICAAYDAERDPFSLTGSSRLPNGLNLGIQLFWLEQLFPEAMSRATLVPWAQYWAWFLGGKAVSEVTSLGCHSDLWAPGAGDFSPMAKRLGWAHRFAPLARADEVVGRLRPELSKATGLADSVRILAGIHDSNAALFAVRGLEVLAGSDTTLLATGTWFVAMRTPVGEDSRVSLPENRDCLVNVDLDGRPVPSARFMGGREIELIVEADERRVDIDEDQPALLAAVPSVLSDDAMVLPTLAPGSGPFPSAVARWTRVADGWTGRRAAACLYAALVADASLDLIGATGRLLVEGRFARAAVFVRALAALRPSTQVFTVDAEADVSFGALRLVDAALRPQGELARVAPLEADIGGYRARWRNEIARATTAGAAIP